MKILDLALLVYANKCGYVMDSIASYGYNLECYAIESSLFDANFIFLLLVAEYHALATSTYDIEDIKTWVI